MFTRVNWVVKSQEQAYSIGFLLQNEIRIITLGRILLIHKDLRDMVWLGYGSTCKIVIIHWID